MRRNQGSRTFITNGPVADVFVIFALTDRAKAFGSFAALLVDRTAPGLTVGRPLQKMGLRTSPMAELSFDDCEAPREKSGTSEIQRTIVPRLLGLG